MTRKLLSALYVLSFTLLVSVLWYSQDQTSDARAFVSPDFNARTIPAMTLPNVMIEFSGFPMGPVSLEEINNAFPESTITDIIYDTDAGTDTYDFLAQGGNALAPNPDGSGALYIVQPPPPAQTFGRANSASIGLSAPTVEFGFQLGDFSDDFVAEFMLGDELVARIFLPDIDSNPTRFIQTKKPFNRVLLRPEEGDETGWVLPKLYLATGITPRPIPTLSQWGLIAMAGAVGIIGIIFAARQRKSSAPLG